MTDTKSKNAKILKHLKSPNPGLLHLGLDSDVKFCLFPTYSFLEIRTWKLEIPSQFQKDT